MEPITRKETFMAKAAGQDVPTLEPITREEWFLQQIANAVEGAGGGSVVNVEGATPEIDAAENTIYVCDELTSLTITEYPTSGTFAVTFTSGETPTVLTVPEGLTMPDDWDGCEANKRYEINVMDGFALVASWSVQSDEVTE